MTLEEARKERNDLQYKLYELDKFIQDTARNRALQLLNEIRDRIKELADLGYYFTVYDNSCQDDQAGYIFDDEWTECDITKAPEK